MCSVSWIHEGLEFPPSPSPPHKQHWEYLYLVSMETLNLLLGFSQALPWDGWLSQRQGLKSNQGQAGQVEPPAGLLLRTVVLAY